MYIYFCFFRPRCHKANLGMGEFKNFFFKIIVFIQQSLFFRFQTVKEISRQDKTINMCRKAKKIQEKNPHGAKITLCTVHLYC